MHRIARLVTASLSLAPVATAAAATLTVGPTGQYPTVAAAVTASQNGDTIAVQAGTYLNDFSNITTNIKLTAVGGRVVMQASELLPNEKGIFITNSNVSITGFTFIGARISNSEGENGAGIRYQAGNLVLNQCWFHNNQEGVFANPDATGAITVNQSEFDHNGDVSGPGSGHTHNLYVDQIRKLDVESSYFHAANVGHEIKSRAATTIVNNTRVVDGPTATASYSIDLPNGGAATLTNNQIEQGPMSENPIIIAYGEEGSIPAGSQLTLTNNLIENDLTTQTPLGIENTTTIPASINTTQIYGLTTSQLISGPATVSGTEILTTEPPISTAHPWQTQRPR